MAPARRSPRAAAAVLLAAAVAAAVAAAPHRAAADTWNSAAETAFDPWRHHPALVAEPSIRPVLLRWYEVKLKDDDRRRPFTGHTRYLPRGAKAFMTDGYPWAPLPEARERDKLVGWDLLKLPGHGAEVDDWLTLHLNRDATLCVALRYNTGADVAVRGYTAAGIAAVADGDRRVAEGMELPGHAGLWCKPARGGRVRLPRGPSMGITGGKAGSYAYDVYLGEADGAGSAAPAPPAALGGEPVYANARCPRALHDLWTTPNVDDADADTAGKTWLTWHPQVVRVCGRGGEAGRGGSLGLLWRRWRYTGGCERTGCCVQWGGGLLLTCHCDALLTVGACAVPLRRAFRLHAAALSLPFSGALRRIRSTGGT